MRHLLPLTGMFLLVCVSSADAEPTAAAVSAFQAYCRAVESRLALQHRTVTNFLVPTDERSNHNQQPRTLPTAPVIERVIEKGATQPDPEASGALLHHWRGTAFAPGARARDFERIFRDFAAYPQRFSPEVLTARVLAEDGNHMRAAIRVRQHHVITVVMDTDYDIFAGNLDAQHGYNVSRSTRIAEIHSPDTSKERAMAAGEDHGFLWRQNIYWSYEERGGGLFLQVESVSLSRAIPAGLGWAVRPYVESIPRESMEFTLRSTIKGLSSLAPPFNAVEKR